MLQPPHVAIANVGTAPLSMLVSEAAVFFFFEQRSSSLVLTCCGTRGRAAIFVMHLFCWVPLAGLFRGNELLCAQVRPS